MVKLVRVHRSRRADRRSSKYTLCDACPHHALLLISRVPLSFRSYSNGRNQNRRSPSSAPSTRSSSYHSPTRAVALGTGAVTSNSSRPSSPAMSTRHSTHGSSMNNSDNSIMSNRSSPQSPSPHSVTGGSSSGGGGGGSGVTTNSCSSTAATVVESSQTIAPQSPAHHRTSSGPTIAINLFSEPDPNSCKYVGCVRMACSFGRSYRGVRGRSSN